MMTPHLPVATQEQLDVCLAPLSAIRPHRREPKALGWSGVLGAFTMGEVWFWMVEGQEVATIVPVLGMPYTRREETFFEYLGTYQIH